MLPTIVFLQVFACFDFEECKMNITTCNVASWLESNGKDETGAQDNSLIPLAARVAFINTLRQMSINFPVMVTVKHVVKPHHHRSGVEYVPHIESTTKDQRGRQRSLAEQPTTPMVATVLLI